jgi:hypothetical protein
MFLYVPFDEFAGAAKDRLSVTEAFVWPLGARTYVSACDPRQGLIIASVAEMSVAQSEDALKALGLNVRHGKWSPNAESADVMDSEGFTVVAISYKSSESMPGLWVDASPVPVSEAQALRSMFDEFCDTGEVTDVEFEEFLRQASPNVLILGLDDLRAFLREKPSD